MTVNDALQSKTQKEVAMAYLRYRYYRSVCLEELRKTTKNFSSL
jgi:hypothetical protein